MTARKLATLVLATGILLAATPGLADDVAAAAAGAKSVVGTWTIDVTVPPGASGCPADGGDCVLVALATATGDGTVVQTAAVPGVSTGHGIWRKDGKRRFVVQSTYFRFGAGGNPRGTSVTVTTLDLDREGTSATGSFVNTLYALDGTEEGSFSGSASATKMGF